MIFDLLSIACEWMVACPGGCEVDWEFIGGAAVDHEAGVGHGLLGDETEDGVDGFVKVHEVILLLFLVFL